MTLSPSDTAGISYASLPTPVATFTFHSFYHSDAGETHGKRDMTRTCLAGDVNKKAPLGSGSPSGSAAGAVTRGAHSAGSPRVSLLGPLEATVVLQLHVTSH